MLRAAGDLTASLTATFRRSREQEVTLVTGGGGFVGAHLCAALLAQGHEVHAVDNFITGRKANVLPLLSHPRFHFHELDITSTAFREHFATVPFSRVFHLACPTGVPNISRLSLEMLLTCSLGTYNVLNVARAHGAKLLFTSSCEVYGQPEVCPQPDHYTGNVDPIGPRSPYEEGKRFSESFIITFVRKFQLDAKIVRIFNTYGPGMSPQDQRVMPRFLHSICLDRPIVIYGDGSQTRTFLYVDDLVRGLLLVLEQGKSGEAYNIGGTEQITIASLARIMMTLAGKDVGITHLPHFTMDHDRRQPVVDKLTALGWSPRVSLEDGLQRMIETCRENGYYEMTTSSASRTVAA